MTFKHKQRMWIGISLVGYIVNTFFGWAIWPDPSAGFSFFVSGIAITTAVVWWMERDPATIELTPEEKAKIEQELHAIIGKALHDMGAKDVVIDGQDWPPTIN